MKIGMTLLPLIAFTLAFSAPLGLAGDAPGFTLHPQSVMVAIGDTLRLSCLATGTPPVSYIWKRDSTFLTDQTNALLVITNAQPGHSARYRAVASNDDGLAQSNPAEVIVYTNMPCNFPWVWAQTSGGNKQIATRIFGPWPRTTKAPFFSQVTRAQPTETGTGSP